MWAAHPGLSHAAQFEEFWGYQWLRAQALQSDRLVNSSLLTSLGELCNVFKSQVPHLWKKKRGWRKILVLWELNEIMHIKSLAQGKQSSNANSCPLGSRHTIKGVSSCM